MAEAQDLLDQIDAEQATIAIELEGLLDYQRLNLTSDSRPPVEQAILDYQRRVGLLDTAEAAILALMNDGFPGTPVRPISQAGYDDLTFQLETITAALAEFTPVALALNVSPEVNK